MDASPPAREDGRDRGALSSTGSRGPPTLRRRREPLAGRRCHGSHRADGDRSGGRSRQGTGELPQARAVPVDERPRRSGAEERSRHRFPDTSRRAGTEGSAAVPVKTIGEGAPRAGRVAPTPSGRREFGPEPGVRPAVPPTSYPLASWGGPEWFRRPFGIVRIGSCVVPGSSRHTGPGWGAPPRGGAEFKTGPSLRPGEVSGAVVGLEDARSAASRAIVSPHGTAR